MGCLVRRDYSNYLRAATKFFSESAPKAQLVLGTLPTGSAYPADPAREIARMVKDRPKKVE